MKWEKKVCANVYLFNFIISSMTIASIDDSSGVEMKEVRRMIIITKYRNVKVVKRESERRARDAEI